MEETALTFNHIKKLENIKFPINITDKELKLAEKRGIYIYKNIQMLRDVATFMENPENILFFKKYMENKKYFDHIFSMLKIYEIITTTLNKKNNIECNAYHKLFLLYILINNPRYNYIIFKNNKLNSLCL